MFDHLCRYRYVNPVVSLEGDHKDVASDGICCCSRGFELFFNRTDASPHAPQITAGPTTTRRPATTRSTTPLVPWVDCGSDNLTLSSDTDVLVIESPMYPKEYPRNTKCGWHVNGPSGQPVGSKAKLCPIQTLFWVGVIVGC